ncbi:MAG TPA: cytochrome c peroxidase [Candidatus Aminicenantes bacterium]|nr:cytochrome c peroxidase [Candidatus Aminicenantes bacterium]HRY63869.1 cytochrome c peroxidase [Candidatus Aminicenantes bacterium]HRZ70782.1 cytochrome c peroxidase [Candidatus Aminicenantes bacterium]
MRRIVLFAALLVGLLAAAAGTASILAGQKAPPITQVGVQVLGPQRLGPLPPVVHPPGNPPSSAKIQLGKELYFDPRLSADGTISCATCHDPALGWSDKGPTSEGIHGQFGGRRAPPVSNAAYSPLQFWDGRSPSLEDQAKGPIQNPIEMGNTHEAMIQTVSAIGAYQSEFKAVFGTGPITVDQVADAIAAFERTVVTTDSRFDRYARGDHNALTKLEKEGLEIFNGKAHCTGCHWGPYFSDGRFHNLGLPPKDPKNPDVGRYAVTKDHRDMGAFKTPTVRDAARRPPYLHDGSEKTLESLIDFYDKGGGKGPNLDPLMVPLGLARHEKAALVAFIKSLDSLNPEVADVKAPALRDLPH